MSLLQTVRSLGLLAYGVAADETNPPLRTENSLRAYELQNSAKTIERKQTQQNILDLRCTL